MPAWGKGKREATTATGNGATARFETLGNAGSGNETVTAESLPSRRRSGLKASHSGNQPQCQYTAASVPPVQFVARSVRASPKQSELEPLSAPRAASLAHGAPWRHPPRGKDIRTTCRRARRPSRPASPPDPQLAGGARAIAESPRASCTVARPRRPWHAVAGRGVTEGTGRGTRFARTVR
jgi:hypothetical protein